MNFEKLANKIIKRLKKEGVVCYLYHSTASAYIRFQDCRMGSIRLGDHKGRSQYGYKWNIRSDFPRGHNKWHKIEGKWRFYAHSSNWITILPYILERKTEVEKWGENKRSYYTPKHKRK
jgi:hypothetical protein|tara:strand:- start:40635 stop:40991 length:357 start_codon:yes stop_codon:yes gene_type:complete